MFHRPISGVYIVNTVAYEAETENETSYKEALESLTSSHRSTKA
jgi:hypothetical protein